MRPEHPFSRLVRRLAAIVSLVSIGVALVGMVGVIDVDASLLFVTALLLAGALPWATFIIHLNLLSSLSAEAKKLWVHELTVWDWSGWRPLIAVWAYLVTEDLEVRARQFGSYRGDPKS